MTMDRLFLIFDKVSNHTLMYQFAPTAGALIRNSGKQFYQINENFEEEFSLFEVAQCNDFDLTSSDSPIIPVLIEHKWDEYKKPEAKVEKQEIPDTDLVNGSKD